MSAMATFYESKRFLILGANAIQTVTDIRIFDPKYASHFILFVLNASLYFILFVLSTYLYFILFLF